MAGADDTSHGTTNLMKLHIRSLNTTMGGGFTYPVRLQIMKENTRQPQQSTRGKRKTNKNNNKIAFRILQRPLHGLGTCEQAAATIKSYHLNQITMDNKSFQNMKQ